MIFLPILEECAEVGAMQRKFGLMIPKSDVQSSGSAKTSHEPSTAEISPNVSHLTN